MSRLGVFDSGLGGYDVLNHIHEKYPKQDLVYLADQKNVPYGNKSREELVAIAGENMAFFRRHRIKKVLIACNTISSLELDFPGVETYRIIETTAKTVDAEKVIVLATSFTVNSHAYRRYLPGREVIEIALPGMVRLIEEGASREEIMAELDRNLHEYKNSGISAILGCTHFPLVKKEVEEYLGGSTYESGNAVLSLPIYSDGKGKVQIYTSGDTDSFSDKVRRIYGQNITALPTNR